jgi:hypothetical protein
MYHPTGLFRSWKGPVKELLLKMDGKSVEAGGGASILDKDPKCDPKYLVVCECEGAVVARSNCVVVQDNCDVRVVSELICRLEGAWVLKGVACDNVTTGGARVQLNATPEPA